MFLTIKLHSHAKVNCFKKNDNLYKMDLTVNNPQSLICHKIQPTNQPTNQSKRISLKSAFFDFTPKIFPFGQFFFPIFHGFCDEIDDLVGYFVHFKIMCYPGMRDHIICFL